MEEPFSVRPATEDDLDTLVEIESRVHVAPWTRASFEAELSKPYAQVLLLTDDETDSKIAGYIVFWNLLDEAQILNVAVDLPFRGQGHAKSLVRQVVSIASKKGSKRMVLDVRKSNVGAIQLYQGLGFSIVHIRKNFYSNGEEAFQMALELAGERVDF